MHRRSAAAFSLVEVALALGIFAFVIVAILSVVSVSLSSSRDSKADTVLSEMTQSTLTYLRSNPNPTQTPTIPQGFTAVEAVAGSTTTYAPTPATVGTFYFDVDGQMERDSSGRPNTSSTLPLPTIYFCKVLARLPTTSANPPSLIFLQLEFIWPINAPTANQQERIVNASIANYD